MNHYRRKLFTYKAPYDLEGTEDLFLEAVKENYAFHYESCKAYSKILDFHGFSPKALKGIEENHIVEFLEQWSILSYTVIAQTTIFTYPFIAVS